MVVFGQGFLLGQSGSIRAKVVVFGQTCLIRAEVVLFGQSGCIWAKLDVKEQ